MSAAIPSAAQLQDTFGVLLAGGCEGVGVYTVCTGHSVFSSFIRSVCIEPYPSNVTSPLRRTYFYMVASLPYIGGMTYVVPEFTVVLLLSATSTFAVQTYVVCQWWACGASLMVVISLTQAFNSLAALAIFGALTGYRRAEQQDGRASKHIKQMDYLLTRFIFNGLLGAGFQFAGLLAFVARPHKIAWIPFHFLANKVAMNGLLYLMSDFPRLNLQWKSMDQVNEASFMGSELFARGPSVSRNIQISQDMTFIDDSESVKGGYAVPNQTDTFGDGSPCRLGFASKGAHFDNFEMIPIDKQGMRPY
ncbi:hypothetical protein B0H11DRAFT_1938067 [Mycena galericulata]|nr:hypothetical protein B0H11DRAFT_1938067 [Mycena galericulata]